MLIRGEKAKGKLSFEADVRQSEGTRGTCKLCGGKVHRSHRTGILHHRCFWCRYLVMIYGPNISVTRR